MLLESGVSPSLRTKSHPAGRWLGKTPLELATDATTRTLLEVALRSEDEAREAASEEEANAKEAELMHVSVVDKDEV